MPEGVSFTGTNSNNLTFNPDNGKFEVDFHNDLNDIMFQIELADDFDEDSFEIEINDIKYVADDIYTTNNTENYAGSFTLLFSKAGIVRGDWNGDGEFNLVDIVRYRMYLAQQAVQDQFPEGTDDVRKEIIDLNRDNKLNSSDLSAARQLIVGLITLEDLD